MCRASIFFASTVSISVSVVRISLFIQNLSVALSALCVCVFLRFNAHVHGSERHLLEAAIISLAVIAKLASTAYKIAVEKDWIVIISEGDSSKLASTKQNFQFFAWNTFLGRAAESGAAFLSHLAVVVLVLMVVFQIYGRP